MNDSDEQVLFSFFPTDSTILSNQMTTCFITKYRHLIDINYRNGSHWHHSGSVTFNEVLSISVANNTANAIKVGTQAKATVFEPSVITVTPSGSDTGEKYTIVGLDQFGKSQTEVLTAEGAGVSVSGKKVFSKVKAAERITGLRLGPDDA